MYSVSRQLGHSKPSTTLDKYAAEFEKARNSEAIRDRLQSWRSVMLLAILDCLNVDCSMSKTYGLCVDLSELPELDPEGLGGRRPDGLAPICDVRFGPMTLDEIAGDITEGASTADS